MAYYRRTALEPLTEVKYVGLAAPAVRRLAPTDRLRVVVRQLIDGAASNVVFRLGRAEGRWRIAEIEAVGC